MNSGDGFPASCKDRKQSPALAIAASQDRKLGRDGRIQAIFDIKENSLFRCGPVLSRETRL